MLNTLRNNSYAGIEKSRVGRVISSLKEGHFSEQGLAKEYIDSFLRGFSFEGAVGIDIERGTQLGEALGREAYTDGFKKKLKDLSEALDGPIDNATVEELKRIFEAYKQKIPYRAPWFQDDGD